MMASSEGESESMNTGLIVSSFERLPQHCLRGLCFEGEDLILDDAGYGDYRAVRKRNIHPGQDGSYIVINSSETKTVIGTDFNGYYKIFLYRYKNHWALSNSLIELARFAASHSLPVTVDESHLGSFSFEDLSAINSPRFEQVSKRSDWSLQRWRS